MSKPGIFYAKLDCPLCRGRGEYKRLVTPFLMEGSDVVWERCECAFMGIDGNDALGAFDEGNYEIHPSLDYDEERDMIKPVWIANQSGTLFATLSPQWGDPSYQIYLPIERVDEFLLHALMDIEAMLRAAQLTDMETDRFKGLARAEALVREKRELASKSPGIRSYVHMASAQ